MDACLGYFHNFQAETFKERNAAFPIPLVNTRASYDSFEFSSIIKYITCFQISNEGMDQRLPDSVKLAIQKENCN